VRAALDEVKPQLLGPLHHLVRGRVKVRGRGRGSRLALPLTLSQT